MVAFLLFDFLPPFNKFLIKRHVRDASGQTLTDGLEAVESASDDIPGKEDPALANAKHALKGSLNKPFSGLVDDFPGAFSNEPHEHVGVAKDGKRAKNFINSLDELFDIKLGDLILELGERDLFFEEPG